MMTFEVAILSVQGVLEPRKWLVKTDSAMAWVWGAVTGELKVILMIKISL